MIAAERRPQDIERVIKLMLREELSPPIVGKFSNGCARQA
jgi:hypothetical protein